MNKELDRVQRKALGKGLSALLPSRNTAPTEPKSNATPAAAAAPSPAPSQLPEHFEEFQSIPLDQIRPDSEQPRDSFDEAKLLELSQSIQAHGVIQPITVRREGKDRYRIIAGERRWRAAALAGLTEIPALVRNLENENQLELALIENIQREDLNPIEIAAAFQRLSADHNLSHEQIAQRTGKDRSTVTNFLRLLKLSQTARQALANGEISMGHARALLNVDTHLQASLCTEIKTNQLSVREVEARVKRLQQPEPPPQLAETKRDTKPLDPNIRAAMEEMAMALGTKVKLIPRNDKSGRIEVEYYSPEDLERIYSVIVRQ